MTQALIEPAAALREAATRRAVAHQERATGRRTAPNDGERARWVDSPAEVRAKLVDRDGKQFYQLDGYASVVERAYEMWDFFGPYEEVVAARAFNETLTAKPDVAFLINHTGLTLARTTAGTLELSADALGLRSVAYLNPQRDEARNLALAIEDKNVTEMSFAFMIEDASWNEDYTRFTIERVNLDRGDVSAVNYGANPFTSIAARSRDLMREAQGLPAGAQRALIRSLEQRLSAAVADADDPHGQPVTGTQTCGGNAAAPTKARGRRINLIEALLEVD
jgi:HK97 family phage prohead protease